MRSERRIWAHDDRLALLPPLLDRTFRYGTTKLTDITPHDLAHSLAKLNHTPVCQGYAFGTIRAFMRWAHRRHYLDRNGAIAALRTLGAEESESPRALAANKQFLHALMTCEALASIELACRACGLRFVAWPEILARAPEATRSATAPCRLPVPSGGHLVPDGVFGIEYETGAAKLYRFFALEADRGTMPIARTKPGQTSYLGKLAAYRRVIEG